VVRGPGIPHSETRSQLVNNLDVAATIEQIVGLSPSVTPNGRSLTPILDDANGPWRSAILVKGGNGVAKADRRYVAVRTAKREYVAYEADPYKLKNKAKSPIYAADAATLRALHDKLKSCAGAGCWVP
jgi:arylsulfatase A-like enzyme